MYRFVLTALLVAGTAAGSEPGRLKLQETPPNRPAEPKAASKPVEPTAKAQPHDGSLTLLSGAEWQAAIAAKNQDRKIEADWIQKDKNDVALSGYDVVAYHTEQKAVEGAAEVSHVYRDVTFLFSTAANRDAFVAEPEKFLPEYGGHCAYSMAKGMAVDSKPNAWTIVSGKLLLFARPVLVSTWDRDEHLWREMAARTWSTRQ